MTYTGFPYQSSELSAFAVTYGIFVISLKDGRIIHHTPEDEDHFYSWLQAISLREVIVSARQRLPECSY